MEKKEKVSIKIDTSFYSALGRMEIPTDQALREFIDNSTTSFYDHYEELKDKGINKCKVQIEWDDEKMVIKDNAFGMNREEFGRALRLNAKSDHYSEDSRGQYGIGLKYAASAIGRWYSVDSSQLNNKYRYYSVMDFDLLENKSPDDIDMVISDYFENKHYTTITIKNLYRKFSDFNAPHGRKTNKFDKLIETLSRIYKIDIENNRLEIVINGEKVPAYKYELARDRTTDSEQVAFLDGKFLFNNKEYTYEGYVGLLQTADVSNAGFTLIQKNRAIELNYRPYELFGKSNDFRYQRVIGEIHLTGNNWIVTFTKTGMKWDDNGQEEAFIKSIQENTNVMNLFEIAKKYRKKEENVTTEVVKKFKLEKSFESLKDVVKPVVLPKTKKIKEEEKVPDIVLPHIEDKEEFETIDISYEGINYKFDIITPYKEEMIGRWVQLKVKDASLNHYEIYINTRVNMFAECTTAPMKKLIVKMAIVVCLAQLSSKRLGMSYSESEKFVDKINDILNNVNP